MNAPREVAKSPSRRRQAARLLIPALIVLYLIGPEPHVDTRTGPVYGCVSGSMTRVPSESTFRGDPGACSTGGTPVILSRSTGLRSVGLYLNHPQWRLFDIGIDGVRGFGLSWNGP